MDDNSLLVFDRKRRRQGFWLGLAAGLLFGVLSQWLNRALLGGLQLYQPPLGPLGNTLLFTAIGAVLGLISAWSGSSIFGVTLASLVAGIMLVVSALLSTNFKRDVAPAIAGLIGFYLPFVAGVVPLLALVRGAVNQQRDYYEFPFLSWQRLRLTLVLGLVMVGLGLAFLYPGNGRASIMRMNQMIETGLQANSAAALPQPLQNELVDDFLLHASPQVNFELDLQDLNRYQIPYTPRVQWQPLVVVARFSSGWSLACLYISPNEDPFCRGYEDLAAFMD